jgi:RNase adaptor protein for sRNA GlmZ degradation
MTEDAGERVMPGTPDIVIITGMSGAGRSTAAKSLEDLGWFVVDNLPPALLPTMLDLADRASLAGVAAIVDVRSRAFSTDLKSAVSSLGARGVAPHVLFLEASDSALVQRFENVRRPHPMQGAGTIIDGITAERELLREIRGDSDIVLAAYLAVLEVSLGGFEREGKRYVTLAVGCTGGKHRSVAIAEQLAARLAGRDVTVSHRDLGRE